MSTNVRYIDKYELKERLGRGGMAEVWKAYDAQLQRYVALKILHADLQADPEFLARFVREARVIATLHHPNIVQIHDFQILRSAETNETIAYMLMEYIEGPTLADYIQQTSRRGHYPPPADILNLFASIGRAVDYAHQHGMVHRDIKPANILLNRRHTEQNSIGEPILTDFGIARLLGGSTGSNSGVWLGTALYMSPEQAQGYAGNERSDLYSLGVILYELCTGVQLYQGENPTAIMTQHINMLPTPPALINPSIPPALSLVILRSLAKDPASRFSSAAAMTAAIAEALNLPLPEYLSLSTFPADITGEPTYIAPRWPLSAPGSIPSTPLLPATGTSWQPVSTTNLATPQPLTPPGVQRSTPLTPAAALPTSGPASGMLPVSSPSYALSNPTTPTPPLTPLPATVRVLPTPTATPSMPLKSKPRWGLRIALIALVLLVLAGSGLGALYLLTRNAAPATTTAPFLGHAYFASSGLWFQQNSQGINDEIIVDLHNMPAPASGKNYYAWLLGDYNPAPGQQAKMPIALGKLVVNNGNVHFSYTDPQNRDLVAFVSRFLITEEGGSPTTPSLDKQTWRYYAEIPQTPSKIGKGFSALDYIRHILFEGTELQKQGIHGGVDIRMLRSMQKVWEWASSARDSWPAAPDFIRRQVIRILEASDWAKDIAKYQPLRVLVDREYTFETLFDFFFNLDTYQLRPLLSSSTPGVTPQIRSAVNQTLTDLLSIKPWLNNGVLADARKLVKMTNAQLQRPSALAILNDLATQANFAFVGEVDPASGKVLNGVLQMHYTLQSLATFTVTPYKS